MFIGLSGDRESMGVLIFLEGMLATGQSQNWDYWIILDYRATESKIVLPVVVKDRKEYIKERPRYILRDADLWHLPLTKRKIPYFFPLNNAGIKSWVSGLLSKCPVTELAPADQTPYCRP